MVIDRESNKIGNGLASGSTALSSTEIVTESHYPLGAAHSAVRMCFQHWFSSCWSKAQRRVSSSIAHLTENRAKLNK